MDRQISAGPVSIAVKEYQETMNKKVVIIGAGIGGLSAGIYAKKAGYDAVIYEKNALAGGECMGWNRKGHHIDNCIHWLTGTNPKTDLWQVWKTLGAIDEHTEYYDEAKYYSSILDGKELSFWHDLEQTRQELIDFAPEDTDVINTFIEYVRYAGSCVMPVKKPMDMMSIREYLKLGREMPNMPKVMKKFGRINMEDFSRMFRNSRLRTMMTDYLCRNYTAASFVISYAMMAFENGRNPVGGSLAMTNRIVNRFRELGGQLHLNAPVEKVLVCKNRATGVLLASGEEVYADAVISAVNVSYLFENMLDKKYMPRAFKKVYADTENYPILSGFQAAYSIPDTFPERGTVCFDCEPLTIGSLTVSRMSVKNYVYEKAFAPQGRAVLQSNIALQDDGYRFFSQMDAKTYHETKQRLTDEVTKRIIKQFPELAGNIELLDSWTPRTYERYCHTHHGAYMSYITTKKVKQFCAKGVAKNLKDLYLAGQWLMSPGGLPVAAVSGKFAIQRILKKEGRPVESLVY